MTTALELIARGLEFCTSTDPSNPLYSAPFVRVLGDDSAASRARAVVTKAEFAREIQERAARYLPLVRATPTGSRFRIATTPETRWGRCQGCDDEIEAHRSYLCPLCVGAIRSARKTLETP